MQICLSCIELDAKDRAEIAPRPAEIVRRSAGDGQRPAKRVRFDVPDSNSSDAFEGFNEVEFAKKLEETNTEEEVGVSTRPSTRAATKASTSQKKNKNKK